MKLKAVLFDFDGTLVKSIDTLVNIFSEVLTEQNLPVLPPSKLKKMIGQPLPDIFRTIIQFDKIKAAEKRFREIETKRNNANEIGIFTETIPTLEFLQSQNLQLGIVSTKKVDVIEKLARELEIWDFFEVVVGRDLISKPKPNPEPIFFACEKLGVNSQEILFVGDSLFDLKSARNANSTFVGVLTGVCDQKEFTKNQADYVFKHIGELINLFQKIGKN